MAHSKKQRYCFQKRSHRYGLRFCSRKFFNRRWTWGFATEPWRTSDRRSLLGRLARLIGISGRKYLCNSLRKPSYKAYWSEWLDCTPWRTDRLSLRSDARYSVFRECKPLSVVLHHPICVSPVELVAIAGSLQTQQLSSLNCAAR